MSVLEDPLAPSIFPSKLDSPEAAAYHQNGLSVLPATIQPRQVTLRDHFTTATLIPISTLTHMPLSLLSYLCTQINREIEKGDTYAMAEPMTLDNFCHYWFLHFVAVMLLGDWGATMEEAVGRLHSSAKVENDWDKECLGSFCIKPNYPGRSSHVCSGTFLVTDGVRNRGVGRLMGEAYLDWAPKLGFTYSVFNLVYETNLASCRIWDTLGFKKIGRVKGCGRLRGHEEPVDAIIYGRELSTEDDDVSAEEARWDKIKFYLKNQKYPDGIGRAEKSRLRSAALHYRVVVEDQPNGSQIEKLFLKNKQVITDPKQQLDIAQTAHRRQHEGINKTCAKVTEKYHWVGIKETVMLVIKQCTQCSDPTRSSPNTHGRHSPPGIKTASDSTAPQPLSALRPSIPAHTYPCGLQHARHQFMTQMTAPAPISGTHLDPGSMSTQMSLAGSTNAANPASFATHPIPVTLITPLPQPAFILTPQHQPGQLPMLPTLLHHMEPTPPHQVDLTKTTVSNQLSYGSPIDPQLLADFTGMEAYLQPQQHQPRLSSPVTLDVQPQLHTTMEADCGLPTDLSLSQQLIDGNLTGG